MRILFLLPLLFCCTAFSQPHKLNVESPINSVTVFTSGAQITRIASASILPGKTEVIFSGLSNQLEPQSIQLKADANITLLSVQAVKDFESGRRLATDEKALLGERTTWQDKMAAATRLLQVYKKEEDMITKNEAIGGQTGIKPTDLKLALDLHRSRLTEVYQKQLEIEKQLIAYQNELAKATAQMAEVGRKRDSVNYTIMALIDSRTSQAVKFQLLYTIKDAGWFPTYDMRVTDVTKPLSVLMNANVFQRSGETWSDVNVQLSTGNPGDNATPSDLQPWMLGFYDPSVAWMRSQAMLPGVVSGRVIDDRGMPVSGATVIIKGTSTATTSDVNGFFKLQNIPANGTMVVSSVGYSANEIKVRPGYLTVALNTNSQALSEVVVIGYGTRRDGDADEAPIYSSKARKEIETVAVTTKYQPTTTVYQIAEKYTFETDGKTTTIGIKQLEIPALYEYVTAPKIEATAYLTAKILNWQDYDLQSGETNLYYEGTFLGKTYLDLSSVSDTLSLSLGKDNSIKVNRKLVREFSAKKFIGSNRTDSREYELTITNTKKIPVSLLVKDQFPVSVTKEITVEEVSAPEAQLEKQTGLASWRLDLQPGQEKKVRISYTIKYPKDRRVVLE